MGEVLKFPSGAAVREGFKHVADFDNERGCETGMMALRLHDNMKTFHKHVEMLLANDLISARDYEIIQELWEFGGVPYAEE